jgi:two-component system chemotaxis sensor kinase CheA
MAGDMPRSKSPKGKRPVKPTNSTSHKPATAELVLASEVPIETAAAQLESHHAGAAPTIDDLVTLLMQIEPADHAGFEHLRGLMEVMSTSDTVTDGVRGLLTKAMSRVDDLLHGRNPDAESALMDISVLLEDAVAWTEISTPERPPEVLVGTSTPEAKPVPVIELDEPAIAAVGKKVQQVTEEYLPPDTDTDLIAEFLTESREFLERAEASLLTLEGDPENTDAINTIFRAFHTIKGTSAFLGLTAVSELAHCAESLLSRVRDNEIRCTGGYADLALRSVDILESLIQCVQDALGGRPLTRPRGYEELKSLLREPEASGISEAAIPSKRTEAGADGVANSESETCSPLAETQDADSLLRAVAGALGKYPAAATNADGRPAGTSEPARTDKLPDTSVRVSTNRLDRLIDTVGELVIAQSMVAQDSTVLHGCHHDLMRKITHAGKIIRELQDLGMSMRMVPLKATFQKMTRLVRDLAQKSGKVVHLVTEDRDTEIDRNMVDIINDLLVHMVRNSVDHGIEYADVRERCGKDRHGTVYLAASHTGGNVVVEIRDDGAGLNRAKIVEKAVSKGLIESDKGLSDYEIYNLIFAPGFSTADKVTNVSGRGVGMDVVRKGVETLRGRIDILSEPGKGCTFTIRLPLTLAITDGMLVHVGAERYIIPTANILLSFRPEPGAISTIAARSEMVMLRGELMPVFRLDRLFNIEGAVDDATKGLLVVVSDGKRKCCLLVDELRGQQQVVAKSLGSGLGRILGVSGAAILGDGRVGLILDPPEIIVLARRTQTGWWRGTDSSQPAA